MEQAELLRAREMVLAEDYDYWLRISRVSKLAHLAGVTPYQYRVHKKSLSSQRGAEVRMQTASILVKYADSPRQRRALLAEGHWAASMLASRFRGCHARRSPGFIAV